MTLRVPRLPFSLDPLIAEAKRRARRRRLLLALGVAAGGAVAVTFALQSGSGGAQRPATRGGAGSGGTAANNGPVLADGVAPVIGGTVVATVIPHLKLGQSAPEIVIATAPIDASGNFVLRPAPASRALAAAIVKAITKNNGWVNLDLSETGADRKTAVTSFARQYVDASGKPFSLAEFRAAPGSGHWIGDGTGSTTVDPKSELVLPPARGSLTNSR